MRVFGAFDGVFGGLHPIFIIVAGGVLLIAALVISLWRGGGRVFIPLAIAAGGACCLLALLSGRFSSADVAVFGLLYIVAASVLYVCLLAIARFREARRRRREKRLEESRRAVFTLPDRENTFVRDKLNTSLRAEGDAQEADAEGAEKYDLEENKLRLNHVREMLVKLKAAQLSPGDRLEAEGISRLITLYATKSLLSAKEIRELNDCLSAVLKMTAKYAL